MVRALLSGIVATFGFLAAVTLWPPSIQYTEAEAVSAPAAASVEIETDTTDGGIDGDHQLDGR